MSNNDCATGNFGDNFAGYAQDRIWAEIGDMIRAALGYDGEVRIEHPPQGIDADLAVPCFPFAKALKKAPPVIAAEAAGKIPQGGDSLIAGAEAAGGYVNIRLNGAKLAGEVFRDFELYSSCYGDTREGEGKTIVMDFSSPNIAKPFSVGNIRSTIIGHAIYSLFKSQGYRMVGINHLGDWGTQFGKLIYAYQAWGDREKVEKDPIRELLALYVRFHEECRQGQPPPEGEEMAQLDESAPPANPLLEEEARKRFKLLEDGDEEAVALWKWFVQVSLQDFSRIYNRLGVSFDFVQGESFYMDKTGEVIELVKEKGLAERDADGSLLVRLDKYGIDTPLLLQKSDGATLYATRDMAGLIYRTRTFSPSMILYVVGSEQKLHFRQCFQLFHLLGFDARCHHIDFGIVSLKEGKMSTRAGRVIFFEDVLEEACQRVAGILEEKRPDLQMEEKEKIAQVVGIGAVKFNDLSQSRVKNVIFDWDKMLSFDGDTAPYLQYSYARVQSILRKADAEPKFLPGLIKEKAEIRLIGFLARFPGAVREAAGKFSPHLLAQYLLELARCFTEFYQAVPVLKAGSGELTASRLGLIRSYAAVMKKGLMLLGIDVLDRM